MSQQVLFNGVVLVKPSGATKVDASLFASAALGGQGIVGLIGEAERGAPGAVNIFTSPEVGARYYGGGPLADAVNIAFQPAKDARVPAGAAMVVCFKTNFGTPGALGLNNTSLTSHTGTGTGTIAASTLPTPGGGAPTNPAVYVKIIGSGAPGTATFQVSADGTTYGTTIPTPASGSVSVLGGQVSLTFTGTFVANDVYQFAAVQVAVLTTKDYGDAMNKTTALLTTGPNGGRILQLQFNDTTGTRTETSPEVGGVGEMSIRYTGNGSAAALTLNPVAGTFAITVTGATDGSGSVSANLATYSTVAQLVAYLSSQPGFTATAVSANPYVLGAVNFDAVTALDVKTATVTLYAKGFRLLQWVSKNSTLISGVVPTGSGTGQLAPDPTSANAIPFSGGSRGYSLNSDFQAGFTALGRFLVNQIVPLVSYDLVNDGTHSAPVGSGAHQDPSGFHTSTATFASVAAMTQAHAQFYSSTAGKRERQAYIGMGAPNASVPGGGTVSATKAQILAQAGLINDFNTCLVAQYPSRNDVNSNLKSYPAYMQAVIAAGMRAGSDLAEPLTWKYMSVLGLDQDASWSPEVDFSDMILGGVMIAEQVPNKGFRWVKGITTYTQADNDAYTEESVVAAWKAVAYGLRTFLEDLFIGTKLTPSDTTAIKTQAESKLSQYRKAGVIVDSNLPDGSTLLAFRKLSVSGTRDSVSVSVTISPVSGINFILNSIYLIPAVISA